METLRYSVEINAPREKVWNTMLDAKLWAKWTVAFGPGNSYYEGQWKEGGDIKFLAPGMGGTKAKVTALRPHEFVAVEHIAVVTHKGTEDTENEEAKTWVGATENYAFTGKNGATQLDIEIKVRPEWVKMNEDGWPKALKLIKELAER